MIGRGSRQTSARSSPALVVVAGQRRHERGAQVVGERDVEQRVERRLAELVARSSPTRPALERLVRRREGLVDDVMLLPVRRCSGRSPPPRSCARSSSCGAHVGVAKRALPLGERQRRSSRPSRGARRSTKPLDEVEAQRHRLRQRRARCTRPPRVGGVVATRRAGRGEVALQDASRASTFQLSGRFAAARHRGHELLLLVARRRRRAGMNSSVVPGCSRDDAARARAARRGSRSATAPARRRRRCGSARTTRRSRARPRRATRRSSARHRVELARARGLADRRARPSPRGGAPSGRPGSPRSRRAVPSRRSRYSPKLRQSHGTPASSVSSGMPSTRASMRIR